MAEMRSESPPSESRVFYRRVLSSIFTQGAGLLIGFVGSIILARSLGPDGRGAVSWIISLHILGAAVAQVGMPQVNRRYGLEHASRTHHLVYLTIIVCGIASLVLIPFIAGFALLSPIGQNYTMPLLIAMLGLPLLSIADTLGGLQIGLGRAKAFNLANLTQKFLSVALVGVCAWLSMLSPLTAIAALMLGVIAKLFIAILSLRGHLAFERKGVKKMYSEVRRYMGFSSVGQIAMLVASHGTVVLLGILSTATEVGYYAAPFALIEAMCIVPKMFGMYIVPRIVAMKPGMERIKASRQTLCAVIGIMAIGAALAAILTPWMIPLLFGKDFYGAIPAFYWLLAGSVTFSAFTVLYGILSAETDKHLLTYPPLLSATLLLVCSVILFKPYGAIGGAIAWTCANTVASIACWWLLRHVRRKLV